MPADWAKRLLARSPKSVEAHVLIGNSIGRVTRLESAVDAYEKALQIEPTRAATYSEIGSVQVRERRLGGRRSGIPQGGGN
jgi:cytochrome c-type biogenesis protein CcmH/NrfG